MMTSPIPSHLMSAVTLSLTLTLSQMTTARRARSSSFPGNSLLTNWKSFSIINKQTLTNHFYNGKILLNNFFFVLFRSPDNARIRSKMLYASSKDRFRRELDGIQVELQATDPSEMSFDIIKARAFWWTRIRGISLNPLVCWLFNLFDEIGHDMHKLWVWQYCMHLMWFLFLDL